MARTYTEEELAQLSDDEIMSMAEEPVMASATPQEDPPEPEEQHETAQDPDPAGSSDEKAPADGAPDTASDGDPDAGDGDEDVLTDEEFEAQQAPKDPGSDKGADDPEAEAGKGPDGKEDDASKQEPAKDELKAKDEKKDPKKPEDQADPDKKAEGTINYEAEYKKLMAPFKAAGKMVNIRSPEEAVKLMQMGAHYTKKMQALQPNLKLLKMLEKNQLLDENKIGYLIDLNRKDPNAIRKLVKESGVDPMEIDTESEPEYRPGGHKVSDQEMAFSTTLEELASESSGQELITSINRSWDRASKDALWEDPNLLKVLNAQKENGIYDQISQEIDRRQTLGELTGTPFLIAYRQVGNDLETKGQLTPKSTTEPKAEPTLPPGQEEQASNPAPERRVVETRQAARKSEQVSNSDKARAASPSRGTGRKQPTADFNPLAMSDEEFEKHDAMARKL